MSVRFGQSTFAARLRLTCFARATSVLVTPLRSISQPLLVLRISLFSTYQVISFSHFPCCECAKLLKTTSFRSFNFPGSALIGGHNTHFISRPQRPPLYLAISDFVHWSDSCAPHSLSFTSVFSGFGRFVAVILVNENSAKTRCQPVCDFGQNEANADRQVSPPQSKVLLAIQRYRWNAQPLIAKVCRLNADFRTFVCK